LLGEDSCDRPAIHSSASEVRMSKLKYSTSMSLDGYVAGINQSADNPLGVRGELLHRWMRELEVWRAEVGIEGGEVNASSAVIAGEDENLGAIIMGRNMFGGGPGPWPDPPWNGWWGTNPPFHLPVVVLSHFSREPLIREGGTTFTFVTEGLDAALEMARDQAQGRDIAISGGASVAQQFLAAGLVDEFMIHLVPVLLGDGVRLFDASATYDLEQVNVIEAPGVVHLTYQVSRPTLD
jgi:dihydrofolate reductase